MIAALLFSFWLLLAFTSVLSAVAGVLTDGRPQSMRAGTAEVCGSGRGLYCGAVSGFLTGLFYAGLLYAAFLLVPYRRVIRAYQQRARLDPRELVRTVGSILGEVVGREQLCEVLIDNLRAPKTRRPQILIGGIGTGKTAVLVRVVEMLVDRGMVPVVLRLRDVKPDVDFQLMARDRFAELVDNQLRSSGEADRVWRQLRADNRVVVLGDGLEEALPTRPSSRSNVGNGVHGISQDRDTMLRLAIRRAIEDDLPLLITSRPHDPLRGMEATITELEPLGGGPALEYLLRTCAGATDGGYTAEQNAKRLNQLVRFADVVEAPLYLQIIQRLNSTGRLWQACPEQLLPSTYEGAAVGPGRLDRAELRWRLLEGWRTALVQGYEQENYALDQQCREATIEVLSALACIGLKQDLLEVRFEDLAGRTSPQTFDSAGAKAPVREDPLHPSIWDELGLRLDRTKYSSLRTDLSMAATWGAELGIVEAYEDRVRFRHSLIEAYLGSRYLAVALEDGSYRREAFYDPGREFLLALIFRSRAVRALSETVQTMPMRRELIMAGVRATTGAAPTTTMWRSTPDARVESRRMARHMVDLLRQGSDEERERDPASALAMLSAALEIDCCTDAPDPTAMMEHAGPIWDDIITKKGYFDRTTDEARLRFIKASRAAIRIAIGHQRSCGDDPPSAQKVYWWLYTFLCKENSYPIKLAAAHVIGAGGDEAFNALRREFRKVLDGINDDAYEADDEIRRARVMCAWLAPMLYRSSRRAGESAKGYQPTEGLGRHSAGEEIEQNLDRWIRAIQPKGLEQPSISLEIALAQGFKHAANQREQPTTRDERACLIEKTEWALQHSRYWFTHLTLIQALTLCSLPNDPDEPLADRGHGSDPREQVKYWVKIAGSHCTTRQGRRPRRLHPFVKETGNLCVLALSTRRPAEYCWIDESGVADKVGSYSGERASQYGQDLWIMDSVGWSTLHPRAQRLVADILLLLNLADRGDRQPKIDERLARADRPALPPCITTDRSPLAPDRGTVGAAQIAYPGSNCVDDCHFRLCPYPPQGTIGRQAELNEGFCARQAVLARRIAPWQNLRHRELRRFWQRMAQRARPRASDGPNRAGPRSPVRNHRRLRPTRR